MRISAGNLLGQVLALLSSSPLCREITKSYWNKPWFWERLKAGEEGDRGQDGWMASLTRWTWVWASSEEWWRTGKPGVLQSMGSQGVGHDWATEQQETSGLVAQSVLSGELTEQRPSERQDSLPRGGPAQSLSLLGGGPAPPSTVSPVSWVSVLAFPLASAKTKSLQALKGSAWAT